MKPRALNILSQCSLPPTIYQVLIICNALYYINEIDIQPILVDATDEIYHTARTLGFSFLYWEGCSVSKKSCQSVKLVHV